MKVHPRWVLILLAVLTLSLTCLAQDTGQLTGTVHDSSGAAVANANVVVSNSSQGLSRPTTTNSTGDWLIGGLPGGTYDVSVSAPGFKTFQAKGIVLRVGQKLRADATMQVGATSTEITVQGTSVAQVETQSSELAGTVTSNQISQLQLNGRNFTQLVTLVPGVSNQTGQDEGTVGVYGNVAFSFNGGRTEYNNWELDGGDNMDNGSNSTLNVYPSIDAIAEVRVLTSNYGAQYGRNGSGTVEAETKSGTNAFHGDAYEFVRNDAFNARNYFDPYQDANGKFIGAPPYKKNDYGYTIGGPVYIPGVYNTDKQKTFFFWSQEWRKDRVPGQTFSQGVPSVAERAGNFSDLCPNPTTGSMDDCPINPATGLQFPGNIVPVDTVNAPAFLQQIPLPTAGVPGQELFNASPVQPTDWREELIRVDHNFSPKLRAMFRYIHDSWETVTAVPLWTAQGSFPTTGTKFGGPGTSIVARLTATASPTLLNEFVFSYTTDHIILNSTGAWQRPAGLTMGAFFQNGFQGKVPGFEVDNVSAYGNFGQDAGSPVSEGIYNSNPTYTYRDNLTKIAGRHNLVFGAYAVTAQKNELGGGDVNGYFTFDGSNNAVVGGQRVSTGNAFADLLMGRVTQYTQTSKLIKFYNRYKILEPYFNDDWRVTDRLTLNLGLRVSLFGTYRERYNNAWNWVPSNYDPATAPVLNSDGSISGNKFAGLVNCGVTPGVPIGCMNGHLFNPAPRIGFAYDPTGSGRTAIRGGYGVFFEHTNGNEAGTESLDGQSSPLLEAPVQQNIVGYTAVGAPGAGGLAPQFPLSMLSIPTQAQWPYVQQWHLDVQHEVLKNTVLTVSYVGSKGTHLGRQLDINQLFPVPGGANPFLPGQPITDAICANNTVNGQTLTPASAAYDNLRVACGDNADFFRPFRGFSDITRLEYKASSIYHAFQTSFRRSVGNLQLSLAYTWSHSIDDSSDRYDGGFVDSYDPSLFRASSNFDQRHILNISYVYNLPSFQQSGWMNAVLGGWQYSGIISYQTGTPFTPTNGFGFSDNGGLGNGVGTSSYPDLIGDPNAVPAERFTPGVTGPLLYNPGAFAAPTGLTFGNAGRNSLRNPSDTNFDMALYKNFKIKERAGFEFRAEAFNIFNHTEWNGVNTEAGSNDFLHPSGAHRARVLQLGLKFLF